MEDTILVTGATGFIGSHVVEQLLNSGRQVRFFVRSVEKLTDVGIVDAPNLEVVQGDLLDRSTIAPALKGVTHVFHIAGFISTHPKDSQKVFDLNYTISLNLFEECKTREIKKIVYLASIFALAGASEAPLIETAHYNLSNFNFGYFRAKRKTELYAKQCVKSGELPIVFMYPGFCYGPGDVYISSSRMIVLFLKRQLLYSSLEGRTLSTFVMRLEDSFWEWTTQRLVNNIFSAAKIEPTVSYLTYWRRLPT